MADNTFVNIGGHKVSAGIKYSTTEVKTGDVWIDGKPIYRRVLRNNTGTLSYGTTASLYIDTSFKSGEIVPIKFDAYLGGGMHIPWYYTANQTISGVATTYATQSLWIDFTSAGTRLVYNFTSSTYASNFSNLEIFVMVEYTKTTD